MVCKNCGKKLRRNEKFCTVCGYYNGEEEKTFDEAEEFDLLKEETKEEEMKFDEIPTKSKEKKQKEKEDELLKAYIGEDYKLIKKFPVNIYAFILNWAYVIYRKLYITGILGLIITGIVITFFKSIFLIYAITTMIILGLFFNKYYIYICKRRIEKIKSEYDGTDIYTLREMCEERGGVNAIIALILYFIFILFIVFCNVSIFVNTTHNTKFWKENSENKANCISLIKTIYNNLDNYSIKGSIEGGTCKVLNTSGKEYSIYIKTMDKTPIYTYFETNNSKLIYKNSTSKITELEKKQSTEKLSVIERTELNSLKQLENTYNDIISNSKAEDKLIEKKKNKSEKLNYSFTKQEIIR